MGHTYSIRRHYAGFDGGRICVECCNAVEAVTKVRLSNEILMFAAFIHASKILRDSRFDVHEFKFPPDRPDAKSCRYRPRVEVGRRR